MFMTAEEYERLVLAEPDEKWELECGRPRRKPPMTWEHNQASRRLARRLMAQLPEADWVIGHDDGRARWGDARRYYIPDVFVASMAVARRLFTQPGMVEAYPDPLPLVVEVWSPSTGDYDVDEKLRNYQERGDLEIWRLHPPRGGDPKGTPPYQERTLTTWRKQPDGSYVQTVYTGGIVRPVALPNVAIDLDALLE